MKHFFLFFYLYTCAVQNDYIHCGKSTHVHSTLQICLRPLLTLLHLLDSFPLAKDLVPFFLLLTVFNQPHNEVMLVRGQLIRNPTDEGFWWDSRGTHIQGAPTVYLMLPGLTSLNTRGHVLTHMHTGEVASHLFFFFEHLYYKTRQMQKTTQIKFVA